MICAQPLEDGIHVPECSVIAFATNPPSSGPHYPRWAMYGEYTTPATRGFWVHSLEHGAVVLAYNCPQDCAADVLALEAILAALPQDPRCTPPVKTQLILTPDPHLASKIAAASWGYTLTADCVEAAAVQGFISAHSAAAPEDNCDDGLNPTDPASGLPANCGEP